MTPYTCTREREKSLCIHNGSERVFVSGGEREKKRCLSVSIRVIMIYKIGSNLFFFLRA